MIGLLAALLCVVANGFFVGAEFALAKVRPTALEALARQGDRAAARALDITQKMPAYLSATQLGITLASLGLGSMGEPAIRELLLPLTASFGMTGEIADRVAVTIGFASLSALHIVVGELVPKSLALQRAERMARASAFFLRGFYLLSYPALIVLNGISNFVLRALGLPSEAHAEGKLSLEELQLIIQASLDPEATTQRAILERVLRATDRSVRAIMVPRVDMEILSLRDGYETWMSKVRRFGYSRYPVSESGDPDHVVGYVYVKDLLMTGGRERVPSIASLRRDILFVPEGTTVGELLTEMQKSKIPIALVVDEYGGTSGLATLEDLVSEIVGDVQDERSNNAGGRVSISEDGSLVADGTVHVDEILLDGHPLPPLESADTIGMYVLASLGRLASPGDRIGLGKWEAVVEDVRARRVHRVRFRKREASDSAPPEATGL